MLEGHLDPHRGWELIRDGGTPTAAEANHLRKCHVCSGWLDSFADLARNAGFTIRFVNPQAVPGGEHVSPERGWAIIRDDEKPAEAEVRHLLGCRTCNTWLTTFVNLARKAGFHVSFEVPPYPLLEGAA
jgi:hypothetical protein